MTKTGISNLNGLYTYTGPTTINGGTLSLRQRDDHPAEYSAHQRWCWGDIGYVRQRTGIDSAQTLSGGGTIPIGNLSINGTLVPGGGPGVLTCSNNVTLAASSTNVFALNQILATNSLLRVSGSLAYGGILMVTNLSGTLVGGESFKLCNAGSASGTFAAIAGSPGPGLDWKFNPTNGVLAIYSTAPASLTSRDFRGWGITIVLGTGPSGMDAAGPNQ